MRRAADGAYWASWAATRSLVDRLTRELLDDCAAPAEPDSNDRVAAARLAALGVEVTTQGDPKLTQEAEIRMNAVSWLKRDRERTAHREDLSCGARGRPPTRRLMARICRLTGQLEAARLWQEAGQWDRERLAACGGPRAGSMWAAPLDGMTQLLSNGHCRLASLKRIGGISLARGLRCECKSKSGAVCRADLGLRGEHFDLCRHAASRIRPHTAMVAMLARRCRASGAHVDVERVVPHLCVWKSDHACIDAVMDVVAWWPGRLLQHCVDCTIRSPHATRYGVEEDITGRAQREKHRRYGEEVWPLATTTYGRLGEEGDALLEVLVAEARAADGESTATQRGAVSSWRRDIERAVQHALADQIMIALGSSGLFAWGSASRVAASATLHESHELSADQLTRIAASRQAALRRREAKAANSAPFNLFAPSLTPA